MVVGEDLGVEDDGKLRAQNHRGNCLATTYIVSPFSADGIALVSQVARPRQKHPLSAVCDE